MCEHFFFVLSNTVSLLPSTLYVISLQFKHMCALVHKYNSVTYAFFILNFKVKFISVTPVTPPFSFRLNTYNHVYFDGIYLTSLISLMQCEVEISFFFFFFPRCGNDEQRLIHFDFIHNVFLMHARQLTWSLWWEILTESCLNILLATGL